MFRSSVLKKVFILFSGFAILQVLIFSAIALTLAYVVEDKLIENILASEVEQIENYYKNTGTLAEPSNSFVTLYPHASDAPEFIRDTYRETSRYREIFSSEDGNHYHLTTVFLSANLKPVIVADVSELLAVRNSSGDFYLLFWLAFFFSLLLSLLLSFYLARYTTKPLIRLAKEVSGRAELGLGRYSGDEKKNKTNEDELAYLARVVRFAFGQLETTLEREKHFNRDLSHELRTPLTIMKNTLSLTAHRGVDKGDTEQLAQSTESMSRTVDVLFKLARQEQAAAEYFSIRGLIETCVVNHYPRFEENAFELDVQLEEQRVQGDQALVKLVISNLIENAMVYSSDSSVRITSVDGGITFTNPSLAALPESAMNAHSKSEASQGLGQGLFLVKRILDSMGWRYHYSLESGVFQFSIFPKA